jgi:hypothetical protein
MSGSRSVNDVEVCVVALRRSGHHAVLNWIAEQLPGPSFHLNNLKVGESPLTTCTKRLEHSGRAEEASRLVARMKEGGQPRPLLLTNYEDCDLRQVFSREEQGRREIDLGVSRRRVIVLLLRDHYNLFASRLKRVRLGSNEPRENLQNALLARRLYVQYAREFLGETRHLGEETVAISFNRWFVDEDYRRSISARLGGVYAESTLGVLAMEGAGSSFDGTRFRDRAQEMDVLGRWRELESSHFFHSIVNQRRLRRYTDRIFGPMGYPHGRIHRDLVGGFAGLFYPILDRFVRRMARHGLSA